MADHDHGRSHPADALPVQWAQVPTWRGRSLDFQVSSDDTPADGSVGWRRGPPTRTGWQCAVHPECVCVCTRTHVHVHANSHMLPSLGNLAPLPGGSPWAGSGLLRVTLLQTSSPAGGSGDSSARLRGWHCEQTLTAPPTPHQQLSQRKPSAATLPESSSWRRG